jgi:serine/threonine-protein kinase
VDDEAVLRVQFLSGRYRLVERLGEGGMSVVWRAYDEVLGRPVAVKVLATKFAADAASRSRIRAEAQAAAVLSHPNITSVYDYGESVHPDGSRVPFVVMELVHGLSLSRRLANGPLPWRTAIRVCGQVAAALAAAHARGLVHRDIKPANVMLAAGGVKVVDFGIAAIVGQSSDAQPDGSVLGTPAYLAPERLAGAPVEPASDVYALGVLLYRALAGVLPWRADTTTQMVAAHQYLEPRPLPPIEGLPAEVAELCMQCLAKAPADRPTSRQVARLLVKAAGKAPKLDEAPGAQPQALDAAQAEAAAVMQREDRGLRGPQSQASFTAPVAAVPVAVEADPAMVDVTAVRPASPSGGTVSDDPDSPDDMDEPETALVPRPPSEPPQPSRISSVRLVLSAVAAAGVVGVTALLATNCAALTGVSHDPEVAAAADNNVGPGAARQSCAVRYQTRRDASGEFDVELTIVNAGPASLHGWTVEFSFPGDQRVLSVQSAGWSQNGSAVVLRDQGANAVLKAGSAVTVGISGTYQTGNPLPTMFALRNTACSYVLVGATGATIGAGDPPPTTPGDGPAGNPAPPAVGTGEPGPPTVTEPPVVPPTTGGPSPSVYPTVEPTKPSRPPKPTHTRTRSPNPGQTQPEN